MSNITGNRSSVIANMSESQFEKLLRNFNCVEKETDSNGTIQKIAVTHFEHRLFQELTAREAGNAIMGRIDQGLFEQQTGRGVGNFSKERIAVPHFDLKLFATGKATEVSKEVGQVEKEESKPKNMKKEQKKKAKAKKAAEVLRRKKVREAAKEEAKQAHNKVMQEMRQEQTDRVASRSPEDLKQILKFIDIAQNILQGGFSSLGI